MTAHRIGLLVNLRAGWMFPIFVCIVTSLFVFNWQLVYVCFMVNILVNLHARLYRLCM